MLHNNLHKLQSFNIGGKPKFNPLKLKPIQWLFGMLGLNDTHVLDNAGGDSSRLPTGLGRAYLFNGVDDHIVCGVLGDIGTGDFEVEFNFKRSANTSNEYFFGNKDDFTGNFARCLLNSAGNIRLYLESTDGTQHFLTTASAPITTEFNGFEFNGTITDANTRNTNLCLFRRTTASTTNRT